MKNFFQAEAFWLRDIYKDSEQPLIGRFIAGEFGGYWLWHRQRDVARIWADENNCQGDHLAYSLISLKAGILLETFKVIFSLVNMNVAFTWACSVSTRSRRVASRPWQANRKSQRSLSGVGVEWEHVYPFNSQDLIVNSPLQLLNIPYKLVMRTWCWIKIAASTW